MPTLDQVKAQIDRLEHKYMFYTKKEVNYLPEIMMEGEYIRALTSGYFDKRTVLAVCTNRRILFLDKGMFFGLKQWQMALDRVQSIDGDYMIAFGSIRIWDGASAINMTMVLAKTIDPFIKEVRLAIDDFRRLTFQEVTQPVQDQAAYAHVQKAHVQPANAAGAAPAQVDVATQLERLAGLKEAGHLTEEEFQKQKEKLLAG